MLIFCFRIYLARRTLLLTLFGLLSILKSPLGHTKDINLVLLESPPMMGSTLLDLGVQSHIVKAAFSLVNIHVNYTFFPPARAFDYGLNGSVDGLVGWVYSAERAKDFAYSKPIIQSPLVFFHHKEILFDWQTFDDLKGHTIGVVAKNFYGNDFHAAQKKNLFTTEVSPLDEINFRKLSVGRITLFPFNLSSGYLVLEQHLTKDKAQMITHHPKPLKSSRYHVLFSKRKANHRMLVKKFNQGLEKLFQSGGYHKILKQHDMKVQESSTQLLK